MTNMDFNNLKDTIRGNKDAVKIKWYDGLKWTDPHGNWYGWADCGYTESICFSGELWSRTFNASGRPTEPSLQAVATVPEPVETLRYCDLIGDPHACERCPYGSLLGEEDECPQFKDKAEATREMVHIARKFLEAAEMLGG